VTSSSHSDSVNTLINSLRDQVDEAVKAETLRTINLIRAKLDELESKLGKPSIALPAPATNLEPREILVSLQKDNPPEELGEMICDNCGDSFIPTHKTITVRHAYCSDECKDEFRAKEKDHQKSEAATNEKTSKPTILPPGGYVSPDDKEGVASAIDKVKAMEKANNEKWKH